VIRYQYLLDTDICIYIAKNKPQHVRQRMAMCQPGELAMSVITCGELYLGAQKSNRPTEAFKVLQQLRANITVLDLDESVAKVYGDIRANLERQGCIIGANDLWIAAHAKSKGLVIVTNNTREYSRITGLTVENWAVAI
jgi:tRNA(fMet)-specific endonuclease VapC